MSITGKKLVLQAAPARTALTDSNSKAVSSNVAKGPSKAVAAGGIPKTTALSSAKPSAATAEKDAVLRECLRKLVGKRVPVLRLLNSEDVKPRASILHRFFDSSTLMTLFSDSGMRYHITAAAEKVPRHSRLRSISDTDQRAYRHRSSG